MARGRMLNAKIADDLKFNRMSINAQFMFMRAIPHLDRDGLISGHPALLLSKIAPLLPQFMGTIEEIITEWEQSGFVLRYVDGETPVIYFLNFTKNQIGFRYSREAPSDFSPPPGYRRTAEGLVKLSGTDPAASAGGNSPAPHNSGANPELLRSNSGANPPEKKGKEDQENGDGADLGGGGGYFGERIGDFEQLCAAYEQNLFGLLSPMAAEDLTEMLREYPVDWIKAAMRVAVRQSKRKLSYVKGILRKWRAEGIEDPTAEAEERAAPAAAAAAHRQPAVVAYTVNLQ